MFVYSGTYGIEPYLEVKTVILIFCIRKNVNQFYITLSMYMKYMFRVK